MRFRILALLAALQAWAGLIYCILLPADPKNQILWGFSIYRLGLLFLFSLIGVAFSLLFFWNFKKWTKQISAVIKKSPRIANTCESGFELIFISGLAAIAGPLIKPTPDLFTIHQRILPMLVWAVLVSIEAGYCFAIENSSAKKINLRQHYLQRWFSDNKTAPTQPTLNRSAIWISMLLLLAILVPSNNEAMFSGLPLSTWPEGLALLLLIPLFNQHLRSGWVFWMEQRHQWVKYLLLTLVIVLKVSLYFANIDRGFKSCYQVVGVEPPNGQCELSFENPNFRYQVTRIDKTLFFNLNQWNLSFLNTQNYNYYADLGNIDRNRVPFLVNWIGNSSFKTGDSLTIDYTGSAIVTIGSQTVQLGPAYQNVKTIKMDVPSGTQPVRVSYLFDDGYRIGKFVPGPFAILRINVVNGNHSLPLSAPELAFPWQVNIIVADSLLWMLLGMLFIYLARLLRPAWRGILLFFVLGWVAWWSLPELTFMAIMALAMTWLLLWQGNHRMLLAYATLAILLWFRVLIYLPDPSFSVLRVDTSDMLTYESFARNILLTHTLEASEAVFYYQALFRYIVFILHMIFGESDMLRSMMVLLILNMGIFLNANLMYKNLQKSFLFKGLGWLAYIGLVVLSASNVVFLIQQGISEVMSWIFMLYAFYIFVSGAEKFWLAAAALIGLAVANRYNQLPALGFLFLVFNMPLFKTRKKLVIISIAVIVLILALLPLHNWVYGHQLAFMPTSAKNSDNLILPPDRLIHFFSDSDIRQQSFTQIVYMFGIVSWRMLDLCIPIFFMMIGWLVTGIYILFKWKSFPARARWLWLLPGLFLGTQFFFYMLANFPRHLFAAYLAMSLTGMYIAWHGGLPEKNGVVTEVIIPPETAVATHPAD